MDDVQDPGAERPARPFGDVEAAADAFEHLPVALVVTEGPELTALAVNAAARSALPGRLLPGAPLARALPRDLLHRGWAEAFAAPAATGRSLVLRRQPARLEGADGVAREVLLDVVLVPRPGPDGTPRGTVGLVHDVSAGTGGPVGGDGPVGGGGLVGGGGVRAVQRALLPATVPLLPAADVAARCVLAGPAPHPSADRADPAAPDPGGDWFDVVARADGSVVLVVGDVVGRGPDAVVVMGQLRAVLRSQLLAGRAPAPALEFLDAFAATVPGARSATVAVVGVGADGDLEHCTAGHPPPLVLGADPADDRYLPPTGAGPLGSGGGFPTVRSRLAVGEAVLLGTDGVLDRPGAPSAAVDLLRAAGGALRATDPPTGPGPASGRAAERVCAAATGPASRAGGRRDDAAALVLARRRPLPDLDVELPAVPAGLPQARAALRSWLEGAGADVRDTATLLQVLTELVANVVDHAHLDGPALPFRVRARLDPVGRVVLDVADRGRWRLPVVTSDRGRGLALVRQLVDGLTLDRSPDGTTATVRHAVGRPVAVLDPTTPPAAAPPRSGPELSDVWSRGGPEPLVTLVGPLDATTVEEAAAHLLLALTEAGAVVTVDLTRVTLLASAGVDLLLRVVGQARAAGLEVRLLAPAGSPAQHVLHLVGLPHEPPPDP